MLKQEIQNLKGEIQSLKDYIRSNINGDSDDKTTNEDNEVGEVDNNDVTSGVANLTLSDPGEYSYRLPDRWVIIKKKYGSTRVEIKCRVDKTKYGILSIIIIGHTGSDWESHRTILEQDPECPDLTDKSPFDVYEDDGVEDIFGGEKIEGIINLNNLEKTLLDVCEVPQDDRPKEYKHSDENIKISRDDGEFVSIRKAIEFYRIKYNEYISTN
ncbi:unnamed protein product [Rhizophagus irregularis]|uniref:Uncharacterized protein n=1 Tax=Rhizophagus irregularis TaxID=588596 RepID=A0A2N1MHA7_9GLOM|nr:hypothetical protein RhiirC2_792452 [Rhizophagus irregularis]CAB5370902.1 unnamed protein product [Rhizophagus irregularis]